MILEGEHFKEKHPKILEHNKKVNEKYNKLRKKAEDYKIFKRLGEENP